MYPRPAGIMILSIIILSTPNDGRTYGNHGIVNGMVHCHDRFKQLVAWEIVGLGPGQSTPAASGSWIGRCRPPGQQGQPLLIASHAGCGFVGSSAAISSDVSLDRWCSPGSGALNPDRTNVGIRRRRCATAPQVGQAVGSVAVAKVRVCSKIAPQVLHWKSYRGMGCVLGQGEYSLYGTASNPLWEARISCPDGTYMG